MSAITFIATDGTSRDIRGSERGRMAVITDDFATSLLRMPWNGDDAVLAYLSPMALRWLSCYDRHERWKGLQSWWAQHKGGLVRVGQQWVNTWQLTLNSCVRLGGCELELMARIHATCEIHGWIPEDQTLWFADLVDYALGSKALRGSGGWEELRSWLLEDHGDVVMSYSVTGSFPPRTSEEDDEQSFYDRWMQGMATLHEADDREISEDIWGERCFGPTQLTMFDFTAQWEH